MVNHLLFPRQEGGPPPMPPRSPEYLAENQAPRMTAVVGSLFVLAMLTVLMRFYVRIFILKTFGWDDWMIVISTGLGISCLAIFLHAISMGIGRHAEAFPPENLFAFFKIMYFYSILIVCAFSVTKLSIGFFLLRLADRTRWRPFLIFIQVFLVAFTIGSSFSLIFQCTPVKAGWDFSLRPPTGTAKCIDSNVFKSVGIFNSSINIATDLIFALIPIPMVWKLQVNLKTRIGLAFILSLGLFASATAIYKTPLLYNFFKELDWSGKGAWYYVWQLIELTVGILAANLPTLKPLFAGFFGTIRTLTKGRTTGSGGMTAPFKSNGYMKQEDRQGHNSYAMKNVNDNSQSRSVRDPYDEDVILGKETYSVEAGTGRGKLGGTRSQAGESDESILSHDGPGAGARRSVPRGMHIVRTTEVNITR